MFKKFIIIITVIILTFLQTSCFSKEEVPNDDNGLEPPKNEDPLEKDEEPEEEIDPILEQIEGMSLEEKVGQLVTIGIEGYTMDETAMRIIKEYHVGGIILFGRNVKNPTQLLQLINSLKEENSKKDIPLFISVDEEGGKVSRVPSELIKIPTSREIGKRNNRNFSYEIGNVLGTIVKAFGFNINFAPVLDIDSNPRNPVIGDRSYGPDEKIVSEVGIEVMRGLQASGVIPVVKHFPGHGDTSVDSHISLPAINKDLDSLMEFELIPFKEAIDNGADAVMIAHILFNKVDSENPSTLSKVIITDILRKKLEFDGVIFTDDLTMGAIMENYDIGEAAIKSIMAGSDILLVCHGYENSIRVLDELMKAVEDGRISEERIDESVYRVLKLKEKYKLNDNPIDSIDIKKINDEIRAVLSKQ